MKLLCNVQDVDGGNIHILFRGDDIDEGLRATSTELTQAILRSY